MRVTHAVMEATSVTSTTPTETLAPRCVHENAVRCRPASSRSVRASDIPGPAYFSARACPMPLAAPVIRMDCKGMAYNGSLSLAESWVHYKPSVQVARRAECNIVNTCS